MKKTIADAPTGLDATRQPRADRARHHRSRTCRQQTRRHDRRVASLKESVPVLDKVIPSELEKPPRLACAHDTACPTPPKLNLPILGLGKHLRPLSDLPIVGIGERFNLLATYSVDLLFRCSISGPPCAGTQIWRHGAQIVRVSGLADPRRAGSDGVVSLDVQFVDEPISLRPLGSRSGHL